MSERCLECGAKATWMRSTQFAGEHPYCDKHARMQNDFDENDSYAFWYEIKISDPSDGEQETS